jgi:hypothetical protein
MVVTIERMFSELKRDNLAAGQFALSLATLACSHLASHPGKLRRGGRFGPIEMTKLGPVAYEVFIGCPSIVTGGSRFSINHPRLRGMYLPGKSKVATVKSSYSCISPCYAKT